MVYTHTQLLVGFVAALLPILLMFSKRKEPAPLKFHNGGTELLKLLLQEVGTTIFSVYLLDQFGLIVGVGCYLVTGALLAIKEPQLLLSLLLRAWLLTTPGGAILLMVVSLLQRALAGVVSAYHYERLNVHKRAVWFAVALAIIASMIGLTITDGRVQVFFYLPAFFLTSRIVLLYSNCFRAIFFLAPQAIRQEMLAWGEQDRNALLPLVSRIVLTAFVTFFSLVDLPRLPLAVGLPLFGFVALINLGNSFLMSSSPKSYDSQRNSLSLSKLVKVVVVTLTLLYLTQMVLGHYHMFPVAMLLWSSLIWFDGYHKSFFTSWLVGWLPLFVYLVHVSTNVGMVTGLVALLCFAVLETFITPLLAREWGWSYRLTLAPVGEDEE